MNVIDRDTWCLFYIIEKSKCRHHLTLPPLFFSLLHIHLIHLYILALALVVWSPSVLLRLIEVHSIKMSERVREGLGVLSYREEKIKIVFCFCSELKSDVFGFAESNKYCISALRSVITLLSMKPMYVINGKNMKVTNGLPIFITHFKLIFNTDLNNYLCRSTIWYQVPPISKFNINLLTTALKN